MPTQTCLILQPIHAAGIDRLRAAGITPRLASSADEPIDDATAIITRSARVTAEMIAAAPHLRVIGVHGVGTNGVAMEAAQAAGVTVVNTPGANTRSVAEHAIALTFALAKDMRAADAAVRQSDFDFKYRHPLTELDGLTFGIIGFGATGQMTAKLAHALGMATLAFGPTRPDSDFVATETKRADGIAAVLSRADVISLHLPLKAQTAGLIGPAQFALMKPGAFLINVARGGIVDEMALLAALDEDRIAGAGLDVFSQEPMPADHPLLSHPRVILSPHSAGSTEACLKRTALAVADKVIAALASI